MIIFFNKKTGKVIGSIDGRVHPKESKNWSISDSSIPKKDIGKMIIGIQDKKEHNLDKFDILQDIENEKSKTTIFDFSIDKDYNLKQSEIKNARKDYERQ